MPEKTDEVISWNASNYAQCEDCERFVVNLVEASRILDEVSKSGLGSSDQEALRRYFDYHRKRERGFGEAFRRDFAAARDVYLHQDYDRAILAYAIGLIAFLMAVVLPLLAQSEKEWFSAAMTVCLILLSVPCVKTLVRGLKDKRTKRFENMEQFYRYINSHTLNTPLVIDEE